MAASATLTSASAGRERTQACHRDPDQHSDLTEEQLLVARQRELQRQQERLREREQQKLEQVHAEKMRQLEKQRRKEDEQLEILRTANQARGIVFAPGVPAG